METTFCFLSRVRPYRGLSEAEMLKKVRLYKEMNYTYEVYLEVKKGLKVEYVKVNI